MHSVAALDSAPEMRAVLCLFEGVATGAADGYGRIAGVPAATLLHLGPGLPTASPTCTTRGAPRRRSSTWSATTPPITCNTTRCSPPTSSASPSRVELGARIEERADGRGRRGTRGAGRNRGAGRRRHADPARRHGVERSRPSIAEAARCRPGTGERAGDRRRCQAAGQRQEDRHPAARHSARGAGSRPPAASTRRPARGCCATRSRRRSSRAPAAWR